MSTLDRVMYAFGPDGSYFFNAPSMWAMSKLPKEMQDRFDQGKIAEVYTAALGKEEYFFFLYDAREGDSIEGRVCWGENLPPKLMKYLFDENRSPKFQREHKSTKVVLGPDQSFVAWDTSSIRWSNIPEGLENAIQSWLSPTGWSQGPPRTIALGCDGAYFALSEFGAVSYSIPGNFPECSGLIGALNAADWFKWDMVELASFNAWTPDEFVFLLNTTQAFGHVPCSVADYRKVSKSFASEAVREHYEQEWAESERKEQEKARLAQAEEEERKKKEEERKKTKADLAFYYSKWRKSCDETFNSTNPVTRFPLLPMAVCKCSLSSCVSRKQDTTLLACRHDVEGLLRASGLYSLAWLRHERLAWHPDRFGRKCNPTLKLGLEKKATEMYTIYEELIACEIAQAA